MKKGLFIIILALVVKLTAAQDFDTSNLNSWPVLTNSYESWSKGAFDKNRDPNNPADFGWGYYEVTTHLIEGDSIYVLKTHNGEYKAVSIENIASGVYSLVFSNLDGSDKTKKKLDRSPYGDKNFFYYSLAADEIKNLEPPTGDWDIVFSKYLTMFPGFGAYPVAGVLSNRGVEVSQVEFEQEESYSIDDTTEFPWSTNISTIGYDWKSSGQGGTVIHDTLVYFVRDQFGNINELKFTDYGGAGTGKMEFLVNGIKDSVVLGTGNVNQAYYSLEKKQVVKINSDNEWDLALFAQSSFEAIPVRINDINGAELFVYPKSDIFYWSEVGVGIKESSNTSILSIYPNPATNLINIATYTEQGSPLYAEIISQDGRVVLSKNIQTNAGITESRLETELLQAGVYTVRITGENSMATSRIVVQ